MCLIYGSLLRGEVLNIQRRCGLYMRAINTSDGTINCNWNQESKELMIFKELKLASKSKNFS